LKWTEEEVGMSKMEGCKPTYEGLKWYAS